ncbi:hypothetical protein [Cupriavidus basilensis]|uniref:hypothetical protein n=1 Tax=Cupriavidus basilensis TaxID=68895 RepID=UPI0023E7B81D|nr:hypothetical protein [Cupriavidus basilensis]MDF3885781.1 hypothetical protein [Cupriavidus basilensis]
MNFTPASPTGADAMPTLNLAVQLERSDLFSAIEWTLANARRTGLRLLDMRFGHAAAPHQLTLSVAAGDANLLDLFVKRLENGADVLDVLEVLEVLEVPDVPAPAKRAVPAAQPAAMESSLECI